MRDRPWRTHLTGEIRGVCCPGRCGCAVLEGVEARPDLDADGGSLGSGDRLRAGHVSHTPLLHLLPLLYHLLLSLHFSELH